MNNKFEDKGNFWYCDCYGPNCMKLSINKDPALDGYIIDIDPIVNNSKSNFSFNCSVFYMDIDNVVEHFKKDKNEK